MRTTILGWSAFSGLLLGLMAGLLVFAVIIVAGEFAPTVARLGNRARGVVAFVAFVVVPLVGATLGWLEGRLKLE
jgi:hypothetical protein